MYSGWGLASRMRGPKKNGLGIGDGDRGKEGLV
jgi:hypothetical protein